MFRANGMVLLIVGALLPAAGFADDANTSHADGQQPPVATISLESLHAQSAYAPRWRLTHPVDDVAYANDWSGPMNDFDFQESGILGRVSKLRGLSFLTLAELGRTRLFLGVNKEGLVGLHFRAFPHDTKTRYLELARMPYLKSGRPDSDTE